MNCPHCSTVQLIMTERQGIEIDYCPKCRGVWLDRGELDKILERAVTNAQVTQPAQPAHAAPPPPQQQPHYPHPRGKDDSHYGYPYRKRKSWLSELFD